MSTKSQADSVKVVKEQGSLLLCANMSGKDKLKDVSARDVRFNSLYNKFSVWKRSGAPPYKFVHALSVLRKQPSRLVYTKQNDPFSGQNTKQQQQNILN